MEIIDIAQVNEHVDPKGFEAIDDGEYPVCLLGFQIKNNYDQLRHKIPKTYKGSDIVHFVFMPELMPVFFRGIKLEPSSLFIELAEELAKWKTYSFNNIDISQYITLLAKHNLSCDECMGYLQSGIYPINSDEASKLTTTKIDINELYNDIFSSIDIPYFQSIGYIALFMLDNTNTSNTTNKKSLQKIIKDYKNRTK